MAKQLRIGLIGQKFMGRAHSNAFSQAGRFFDLPYDLVPHTVAARDARELEAFADHWGWHQHTTRWRDLAENPELDLVDVATPNHLHAEQAIALLAAGKHVACEKPLGRTLEEARRMRDAARKAKKQKTFVWFNYRRCPAIAFAWKLVREGRIGRVYHVRTSYLQDWGGPDTPLLWRFQKKRAGSGAHGDLNAHLIDLARFLTGDEVVEVHGAAARTFVRDRPLPGDEGELGKKGKKGKKKPRKTGKSDVDDALLFLASFKHGALASFEASRVAAPHQNSNSIEINGEKGSLRWNFEDMNLLWFHDAAGGHREGGWRRIMCTSAGDHPYADAWWPDAHVIGYEHGFTNMVADMTRVIAGRKPAVPLPDFEDAYQTQRVLEAALVAARQRRSVKLSEVR